MSPEGKEKSLVSSAGESGDLDRLLSVLGQRAPASVASTEVPPAPGKLKTAERNQIEKRFGGTTWDVPEDTQTGLQFYFSRDGEAVKVQGPRSDRTGKSGKWVILDSGTVETTGIAGKTFWFTFDTASKGTWTEMGFSTDGTPIPGKKWDIRLAAEQKLPRDLRMVP